MYAKQDILSNDRNRPPYCLKGAVLKISKTHHEERLVIVEDSNGGRFSTIRDYLSTTFVPRDLTKAEQLTFTSLKNILKARGADYFKKVYGQVQRDEITKFSVAENKTMWVAIAEMVFAETYNIQING